MGNKLNKILLTLLMFFDLAIVGIVFWKFGSRMPTITFWSLILVAAAVSGCCINFLIEGDKNEINPQTKYLLMGVGFAVTAAGWALKG